MATMLADNLAELADLFLQHREAGTQIDALPDTLAPRSLDEAYAVQAAVAARVPGGTCGWKIGMTNRAAMQARGMANPVYARLFAGTTFRDGAAAVPAVSGRQMFEAEYVVELDRDLAPGDYSREELLAAIRAVRPGIEICGSRFSTEGALDLAVSLADNSFHRGMVVGASLAGWQDRYLTEPVVLDLDNGQAVTGSGTNVLDDPMIPLAWLASVALPDGGLKAGDLIATGAAAMVQLTTRTARVEARFGDDAVVTAALA